VQLDRSGSDVWRLDPIVELIQSGDVGIIPTDTVYVLWL
jgi:tRNA A37 threonylcarbamoyladenosine synthetase subunit TsaC/SUA5/YrdC